MQLTRIFTASFLIASSVLAIHATPAVKAVNATASVGAAAASGSTTTTAGQVVHVVQVSNANGDLTFSPNNVQANPGEYVRFEFWPKNHSVVQAAFDQPCVPIQNVQTNKTDAFFSGFMPVSSSAVAAAAAANGSSSSNSSSTLTYTIQVQDSSPMWYYCSQSKHCQAGMVGAINAKTTGNKTVAQFARLAASAAENLSPGQSSGNSTLGAAAGSTGTAAASGASASSTATSTTVQSAAAAAAAAAVSSVASAAAETTATSSANGAPGWFGGANVVVVGLLVRRAAVL